MTEMHWARRRFIGVTAAAAGLALAPLPSAGARAAEASPRLRVWRGVALGADAVLQIHHPDPATADRLIERSLAEVRRLEAVFSLYRPDSAISTLNRQGVLRDPPADLVRLLGESEQFSRLTGGAFDITVQPLWRLYATHFERAGADPNGPAETARARALAFVGHREVQVEPTLVRLRRPGAAITLNGIAQGYITDRVTDLLRDAGVESALVDMGETRALGSRPTGGPWRVGVEDPRSPDRLGETIEVRNLAVSTSGGYGTRFDAAGRFNHIFDPKTGLTSGRYLGVTVVAPNATTADALSTAFSLMPMQRTGEVVRTLGVSAHFVRPDGSRQVQSA